MGSLAYISNENAGKETVDEADNEIAQVDKRQIYRQGGGITPWEINCTFLYQIWLNIGQFHKF